MATVIVDHPTKWEKWRTLASKPSLMGSVIKEKESASEWLDRRLAVVAVGGIILYGICFLEFTIGIKKSIKKLINALFYA
jgi:hypothetical protein